MSVVSHIDFSTDASSLQKQFDVAYTQYKSINFVQALELFIQVADGAVAYKDKSLANRCFRIIAKLFLLKADYMTALEYCKRSDQCPKNLILIAKCSLVAFDSTKHFDTLNAAKHILLALLNGNQFTIDAKLQLKIKVILVDVYFRTGQYIECKKLIDDITLLVKSLNVKSKSLLLNIFNTCKKPSEFIKQITFHSLEDGVELCRSPLSNRSKRLFTTGNEAVLLNPQISKIAHRLSSLLRDTTKRVFRYILKGEDLSMLLFHCIQILDNPCIKGTKIKNVFIDFDFEFDAINQVKDIQLYSMGNKTALSVKGQRKAKRRNVSGGITSIKYDLLSSHAQLVRRIWVSSCRLFSVSVLKYMASDDWTPSLAVGTYVDTTRVCSLYDFTKLIKASTGFYSFRNIDNVFDTCKERFVSTKSTMKLLEIRIFKLLARRGKRPLVDFIFEFLQLMLANYPLFKGRFIEYTLCLCIFYTFLEEHFDIVEANNNSCTIFTGSVFNNLTKLHGQNKLSERFKHLNERFGHRFLHFCLRSIKIISNGSIDNSFVSKIYMGRFPNPLKILLFSFNRCIIYVYLSASFHWKQACVVYLLTKQMILEHVNKSLAHLVDVEYTKNLSPNKVNCIKQVIKYLKVTMYREHIENLKRRSQKGSTSISRHKYYSQSNACMTINKYIRNLLIQLKRYSTGVLKSKAVTSTTLHSSFQMRINNVAKQILLYFINDESNDFINATREYSNVYGTSGFIIDFDNVHKIKQQQQQYTVNQCHKITTDFYTDFERLLLDAIAYVCCTDELPIWIDKLLILVGDVLSILALYSPKVDSTSSADTDNGHRSMAPIWFQRSLAICTFCLVNRINGHAKVIDVTSSQNILQDMNIVECFNTDKDLLYKAYSCLSFIKPLEISSGLLVTLYPPLARILSVLLFIINSQAHVLVNQNMINDIREIYITFTAFAQTCILLLLSPFDIKCQDLCTIVISACTCLVYTKEFMQPNRSVLEEFTNNISFNDNVGGVFYAVTDLVDILLQVDGIYSDTSVRDLSYLDIPVELQPFITIHNKNVFADSSTCSTLDLASFCFNRLSVVFRTCFTEHLEAELDYMTKKPPIGVVKLAKDSFIEEVTAVLNARRALQKIGASNNFYKPKLYDKESKVIYDLLSACFTRIYSRSRCSENNELASPYMMAMIYTHLQKNLNIMRSMDYTHLYIDSILFVNDRIDRDLSAMMRQHLMDATIPQVSEDDSIVVFTASPDPLVLIVSRYIDISSITQISRHLIFISKMYDLLGSFAKSLHLGEEYNGNKAMDILKHIYQKVPFMVAPSLKGLFMQIIKSYTMDSDHTLSIYFPACTIQEIIEQLKIINIATNIIPNNFDTWYCCFIKNFEMFLWHAKINMSPLVKLHSSKSFGEIIDPDAMLFTQPTRTWALIDVNLIIYYTLLVRDDQMLMPHIIFFGEIATSKAANRKRIMKRINILLYSKCVLMLYLIKKQILEVPCGALLGSLNFLHYNDATSNPFKVIHKPLDVQLSEFVAATKRPLSSECDILSPEWHLFTLRREAIKRLLISKCSEYAESKNLACAWACVIGSYIDCMAILMNKIVDFKKCSMAPGPLIQLYNEFKIRLNQPKVSIELLDCFYKLHTTRIRLVCASKDLAFVAYAFGMGTVNFCNSDQIAYSDINTKWLEVAENHYKTRSISRSEILEDALSALTMLHNRASPDYACKVALKMAMYYKSTGNLYQAILYNMEINNRLNAVKGFCTGDGLVNFRKVALVHCMSLFEATCRVITVAIHEQHYRVAEICNALKGYTEFNSRVPLKTSNKRPLQRNCCKWIYIGFDAIKELDLMVMSMDACTNLLQKANRKFKYMHALPEFIVNELIYIQDCLLNSLVACLTCVVNACPAVLSLPLLQNHFNTDDLKTLIKEHESNGPLQEKTELYTVLMEAFSSIIFDEIACTILEHLKDYKVLYTSNALVLHEYETATMDLRVLKHLYNVYNMKLINKPENLCTDLGSLLRQACEKLLYQSPFEALNLLNSTEIELPQGQSIVIHSGWEYAQTLLSAQRAVSVYNEAMKNHKENTVH